MPGSWSKDSFPHLEDHNHHLTSPVTNRYNCIAWAAGNDGKWWWPDANNIGYWPPNAPREETLDAFIQAYSVLGYKECRDGEMELGFEKVVIYAKVTYGIPIPTHAARQLSDGKWTSKLGTLEDIQHSTPEGLNGPVYGTPVLYLRRPI